MFRSSRVALAGLFVALALAVDLITAPLPNVELLSLTIFLGGAAVGPLGGSFIGVATELIHSLLNPLGPAFPLVLLGQLIGMGIMGTAGGLLGPRLAALKRGPAVVALAGIGLALTGFFDVITNLGLGFHLGSVWPTLVGGILFAATHVISNAFLFGLLGIGGLRVLRELGMFDTGEGRR